MNKKEIKVSKFFLLNIVISISLSILSLFIVQHFGKIQDIYKDGNTEVYFFNPINSKVYLRPQISIYTYDQWANGNGFGGSYMKYVEKVKVFYIPSLFDNILHIVILATFFFLVAYFFTKYKLRIT